MRTLWRIFAGFFKWTWRLLNFVRNGDEHLFIFRSGMRWYLDAYQQRKPVAAFDARRTVTRYHRDDC